MAKKKDDLDLTTLLATSTKQKGTKAPGYDIVKGHEKLVDQIQATAATIKANNAILTTLKDQIGTEALKHRFKTKKGGTVGFAGSKEGEYVLAEEQFKYSGVNAITADGKESDEATIIKKQLGKDFDENFEIRRSISLNTENEDDLKELVQLLIKNKMMHLLKTSQLVYPKKAYHENKYKLPEAVVTQIDELIKPTRPVKS